MGRSNGRLIPFLKEYLNKEKGFKNLKFEDNQKKVFFVVFPRFMKEKYEDYEDILKEWYKCNGKLHNYKNYSKGKSVFQAALKRSIYLMAEKKDGKRFRYRFASVDEIAENRRILKEKEQLRVNPGSPSSAISSGYHSGSEEINSCCPFSVKLENCRMLKEEEQMKENPESPLSTISSGYHSGSEDENMHKDDLSYDFLDDLLNHPENYISDYPIDENLFPGIEDGMNDYGPQNVTSNDLGQIFQPVTELSTTTVIANVTLKKYWLCTQMIKIKSTLQLICELQIINNENSGIKEGSVIIPNGVFEPGISYHMKKSFELKDMLYIFFVPYVN